MRTFALLAFTLLAACGGGGGTWTPLPTPQPTIDAMAYLGQASPQPRNDWPLPDGYVRLTNLRTGPASAIQSWDFKPYGQDNPERGDGFQTAELGADGWVRFPSTKDGGTPWVQHFVGERCGGTGWLVFRNDAQSGQWKSAVARLAISQNPHQCPANLGQAFTQYRLEQIAFPFAVNGALETRTLPTIISEHFNGGSVESATGLERSYLSDGYGLMRWEAWSPSPPTIGDLSERCGPLAYSVALRVGWHMNDCRTYSIIN